MGAFLGLEIRAPGNRPRKMITAPLLGLVHEIRWQGRLRFMERALARRYAERVLDGVRRRIPGVAEYRAYRRALKVMEVKGLPAQAFAVVAKARSRRLSRAAAQNALIYVESRSRIHPDRAPKYVQVLAAHSPWTPDTLPFAPSLREARVTFRPSTLAEVARARADRLRELPSVRDQLAAAGARVRSTPGGQVVGQTDFSFQALRMEFGFGGRKIEHWRPSVRAARRQMQREWATGFWRRWIWDPAFTLWKRDKRYQPISAKEVKRFASFAQRVRV